MRNDVHYRCPAVAVHDRWLQDVLRVWNFTSDRWAVRDIEPTPSGALFDGLLLMRAELDDREKQRQKDRDRDAEIQAQQGGRKP